MLHINDKQLIKMADAMLSKKEEMNNNKENDNGVVSVSDKTAEPSMSLQRAPLSMGITQGSKRKSPSVSTFTSPSSMNKEMIAILREINTYLNKQGDKIEKLSQHVDYMYEHKEIVIMRGIMMVRLSNRVETECFISDIVKRELSLKTDLKT